jgi:RNA polymerase sigma-70 factor (ECF subfamily)
MEELSARDYDRVYRFVRRRMSEPDAEDLTQDVYEAALSALAEARIGAAPDLAWLYTVARRRLVDTWRKRLPEPLADDLAAPEATYAPRIADALLAGVRRLPRRQREVVVLKLLRGLSFAEIAERVGASEEACRMRMSRGLAELRRSLEEEGVGR